MLLNAAPPPTHITALTTELIFQLAGHEPLASIQTVQEAVRSHLPPLRDNHARQALGQNLTAYVHAYISGLTPPAPWQFTGCDLDLGVGSRPLVWTEPRGRVLADLLHSGPSWQLRAPTVSSQVQEFLSDRIDQFGSRLLGVRHLSVREPRTSWLIDPTGHRTPLLESSYHQMENDRG